MHPEDLCIIVDSHCLFLSPSNTLRVASVLTVHTSYTYIRTADRLMLSESLSNLRHPVQEKSGISSLAAKNKFRDACGAPLEGKGVVGGAPVYYRHNPYSASVRVNLPPALVFAQTAIGTLKSMMTQTPVTMESVRTSELDAALLAVAAGHPDMSSPCLGSDVVRCNATERWCRIRLEAMQLPPPGSISSVRLQTFMKARFPVEYEEIVDKKFTGKWHKFVESVLDSAQSFLYKADDFAAHAELYWGLGADELRLSTVTRAEALANDALVSAWIRDVLVAKVFPEFISAFLEKLASAVDWSQYAAVRRGFVKRKSASLFELECPVCTNWQSRDSRRSASVELFANEQDGLWYCSTVQLLLTACNRKASHRGSSSVDFPSSKRHEASPYPSSATCWISPKTTAPIEIAHLVYHVKDMSTRQELLTTDLLRAASEFLEVRLESDASTLIKPLSRIQLRKYLRQTLARIVLSTENVVPLRPSAYYHEDDIQVRKLLLSSSCISSGHLLAPVAVSASWSGDQQSATAASMSSLGYDMPRRCRVGINIQKEKSSKYAAQPRPLSSASSSSRMFSDFATQSFSAGFPEGDHPVVATEDSVRQLPRMSQYG